MNILGFAGQVWSLSHICVCVCVCSVKTVLVQGLDKNSLCGLDLAQGTCLQTPDPSEKARHRCVSRGQGQPPVACAGHTCVSAETTWREGWAWGGFLEVALESRLRSCQSGPRYFSRLESVHLPAGSTACFSGEPLLPPPPLRPQPTRGAHSPSQ